MKNKKNQLSLILTVALIVTLLPAPALAAAGRDSSFAMPSEYTLSVDGKNVSTWAYKIESDVYFNLRDLAVVLNGTDKQFNVGWDGSRNAVLLTPGTAYTPVGGELKAPANTTGAVAYLPTTVFYIDKRQIPIRTYTVNSVHYVELADLAANLMFASVRDDERKLVKISTDDGNGFIYSSSTEALKDFKEAPIGDVLNQGKTVSFSVAAENKDCLGRGIISTMSGFCL